jgi:hypothetical protein
MSQYFIADGADRWMHSAALPVRASRNIWFPRETAQLTLKAEISRELGNFPKAETPIVRALTSS